MDEDEATRRHRLSNEVIDATVTRTEARDQWAATVGALVEVIAAARDAGVDLGAMPELVEFAEQTGADVGELVARPGTVLAGMVHDEDQSWRRFVESIDQDSGSSDSS